jgi:hypothetical protein
MGARNEESYHASHGRSGSQRCQDGDDADSGFGIGALYPAELVPAVTAFRHRRSVTGQQTSVAMRQMKME